MRYVSYSLFGSDPIYIEGAVQNCVQAREIYPDWTPVFFVSDEIDENVVSVLESHGGMVLRADYRMSLNPRTWRFGAVHLDEAKYVIFRDTDSRLSHRELSAVDAWILSGLDMHIMRDHPKHVASIMAGMWGVKVSNESKETIDNVMLLAKGLDKLEDQRLLEKLVYPSFSENCLVHDSFFRREKGATFFPKKRDSYSYVGEVVEAGGGHNIQLRRLLRRYEKSIFRKFRLRILDNIRNFFHKEFDIDLSFLLRTGFSTKGVFTFLAKRFGLARTRLAKLRGPGSRKA